MKCSFGLMLIIRELRPCRVWPWSEAGHCENRRAVLPSRPWHTSTYCCLPLHISQTKLTECTWPFTHSLFSLALLHSSSSPLLSSSACGLSLTTCLHYCWIVPYIDIQLNVVSHTWTNSSVFLPKTELILLLFRPMRHVFRRPLI